MLAHEKVSSESKHISTSMAEKQVNHLLSTFQRCLALRPQTLLVFSAVVIPTTIWIYDDYRRFLALGPGGNPSTPAGYITVTYLRAFFAHRDPFQPPSLRGDLVYPDRNYLSVDLPARSAPRPVTDGVAPHRMLEQIPPAAVRESLHAAFLALRDAHADIISSGNSCFEKYGLALFLAPGTAKDDPDPRRPANAAFNHLNPTCKTSGEIAHIHDTVRLHPPS